jgi:hypothetical protein
VPEVGVEIVGVWAEIQRFGGPPEIDTHKVTCKVDFATVCASGFHGIITPVRVGPAREFATSWTVVLSSYESNAERCNSLHSLDERVPFHMCYELPDRDCTSMLRGKRSLVPGEGY